MDEEVDTQYDGSPSGKVSAPELGAAMAPNLSLGRPVWVEVDVMWDASEVEDAGPHCPPPPSGLAVEMAKHLRKMLPSVRLFSLFLFGLRGALLSLYRVCLILCARTECRWFGFLDSG